MVLAISKASASTPTSQRGNLARNAPANPTPVTMPIRAQSICTAAISGQVSHAVHNKLVPSCAPAIE